MSKLYDQLKPAERATLVLQALARSDQAESDRLVGACPRKTYSANDDRFVGRMAASFDLMAGAVADLGHEAGKLFILTLLLEMLDRLMTRHTMNATLAFFEGQRHARGEPPLGCYAESPAAEDAEGDDAEGEDEGVDEADADEEGDEDRDETPVADKELGRRLDAVERQAEAATASLRDVLAGMADAVAQSFVDAHAAFDRTARRHLGVDGDALTPAWQFPRADDLATTLVAYKHVQPREDAVAELAAKLDATWRERLDEQGEA